MHFEMKPQAAAMQKTVADYPHLVEEWDWEKNGDLHPSSFSDGSNKKVWWRCGKGHSWARTIGCRVKNTKCPYCVNQLVCEDNCLATTHPDLALEWHTEKNGDLTPYNVVAGTSKKIWWRCKQNASHIWKTSGDSRISGHGCPYCVNQKVDSTNCLATTHPILAQEFHPTKNGDLTPYNIVAGTSKKIWWKCSKNPLHIWCSPGSQRASNVGCPYCFNQKVDQTNCLATTHPELAKEWHPTKNGGLTPYDVVVGTTKKIWWQCSKNPLHIWRVSGDHRLRGRNCPYCSNRKIDQTNCLQILNPNIAADWHPTKNGKITPYNVGIGSHKQIWWTCNNNPSHVWRTSIYHRIKHGSGCPFCKNKSEEKIYNFIKEVLPSAIRLDQQSHGLSYDTGANMEFDIFVPELDLAIEVQGPHHYRPARYCGGGASSIEQHKKTVKNDREKRKKCKEAGIALVEIDLEDWDGSREYVYDRCDRKLRECGIIS